MRKVGLLLALGLLVTVVDGLACSSSNPDKAILVDTQKPQFTLTLKSNPTTGYSWVVMDDYNHALIKPAGHKYQAPNSKLMGAPGYQTFTFRVEPDAFKAPHRLQIHLQYLRSWEPKNPAQNVTFTIVTTQKEMSNKVKSSKKK